MYLKSLTSLIHLVPQSVIIGLAKSAVESTFKIMSKNPPSAVTITLNALALNVRNNLRTLFYRISSLLYLQTKKRERGGTQS